MKATPELKARIVELKLAKVCSVDITERLGVGYGMVDRTWQDYRKAHPGTPAVGTATHCTRRAVAAKEVA